MSGSIGFVGIGMMGTPMVRRLGEAGHDLRLFDLDHARAQAVAADIGGTASPSLAQLGAECSIVITMLPNSAIVRGVVIGGEDNLCLGMQEGGIVIDMSSSDPLATQELGRDLETKGITLLDAPVSGGVRKAVLGTLAIMLGSDREDVLARIEAALAPIGSVYRTGPLGSGHAAKALNNYVSAAGLAAACEAVHVGKAFGLEPGRLVDVLNASTGRNNSTENKLKQYVLSGAYADAGFALELMAKDVSIAAGLAEGLDLDMEGMKVARQLWLRAHEQLGKGADHTEICKVVAGESG